MLRYPYLLCPLLLGAAMIAPLPVQSSTVYTSQDFIGKWTCNVTSGGYSHVFYLTTRSVGTTYSRAATENGRVSTATWTYRSTGPTTGVATVHTTVATETGKTITATVHYTWLNHDHITEMSDAMGHTSKIDCTRT